MSSILLIGLLGIANAAELGPAPTGGPEPDWITRLDPGPEPVPAEGTRDGVYYSVWDQQVRAVGPEVEVYRRSLRQVVAQQGLEHVAEVSISYDPSYQRLILHQVVIWRGPDRIDALRWPALKVIQEESDLSARIYNGRLTALLFLEDVRQGDLVEVSYTIMGENPVLDPHFTDEVSLAGRSTVGRWRYRLLWPAERPLYHRTIGAELEPQVRRDGPVHEYQWTRTQVPVVPFEDRVPAWYPVRPFLQLSDAQHWSEIVEWARPLYPEVAVAPGTPLSAAIERWAAEPDPEERILSAIRFAQREVRYLGMEMGRGSYEPSPPSLVMERRFGDCKDKSYLLAHLLRHLGFEAYPTLVSTTRRRGLDPLWPSAIAFDHAIVTLRFQDRAWFIDATDDNSAGDLSALPSLRFERALILAPDSKGLVEIPSAAQESGYRVEESYEVKDYHSAVPFTVKTMYWGDEAAHQRSRLVTTDRETMTRDALNFYAKSDRSIRSLGPVEIVNDEARNQFMIEERYVIDKFWDGTSRDFYADSIAHDPLSAPQVVLRKLPLAVQHPLRVVHQVRVKLPDSDWDIEDRSAEVAAEAFRLTRSTRFLGQTLSLDYEYRSLVDHLPAAKVQGYLQDLERAKDALGYSISYRTTGRSSSSGRGFGYIALTVGVVFAWVMGRRALTALPAWGRRRKYRQKLAHAEGDAPERPIRVSNRADLEGRLTRLSCGACAAKGAALLGGEAVRFDEREVWVARLRCGRCQRESRVYCALDDQPGR